MDDPTIRLLVVAAAALMVVLVAARARRRTGSTRSLRRTGLDPGVYLFSSDRCLDCSVARERLDAALGPGSYFELTWEEQPEVFEALGITQAPSTLVVTASGRGTWHPGVPPELSKSGNP
jgi:hypothetical protein